MEIAAMAQQTNDSLQISWVEGPWKSWKRGRHDMGRQRKKDYALNKAWAHKIKRQPDVLIADIAFPLYVLFTFVTTTVKYNFKLGLFFYQATIDEVKYALIHEQYVSAIKFC